ncbi:RDH1 dehydrogenase, partial [Nothoprocta pentlandii]|nr:RDH1 dehydrogenase [Nothoprocta pentlandii]
AGMAGARTVLVTGCDGGLGLGLVKALLELPSPPQHLFAACLNPDSKVGRHLRPPSQFLWGRDITDPASIKEAAAAVSERLRGAGLNLLLTGAGPARRRGTLASETAETMLLSYAANTVGPLQVCQVSPGPAAPLGLSPRHLRPLPVCPQAFLPLLLEAARAGGAMSCSRAAIVNLSSRLGSIAATPAWERGQDIGYRCSKAALNMLTKCLALEYGGRGILCVALAPGCVMPPVDSETEPVSLEESTRGILHVLATLSATSNGAFLDWRGQSLPW